MTGPEASSEIESGGTSDDGLVGEGQMPRYIVGIDIGDGESAIAWCKVQSTQPAVVYQRRSTAETSIVTAIARGADDGRRLVGEEAVTAGDSIQFNVNFKTAASLDGIDFSTPDSVEFAQVLLSEFFREHPEIFESCHVFVGHPAGWSKDAVAAYYYHFRKLDISLTLLSESHSALLYVLDGDAEVNPGTDAQSTLPVDRFRGVENVMVVDIGSSTTDVTLVVDGRARNMPVGQATGCREIDRQLLDMVIDKGASDDQLEVALSRPDSRQLLLLACRKVKEAQYRRESLRAVDLIASTDSRYRELVEAVVRWLRGFDIPAYVLNESGWPQKLAAVLERVAAECGADGVSPDLIVMSGGGSRMSFVQDVVSAQFPAATIVQEADPSLAVARGLAVGGRYSMTLDSLHGSVGQYLESDEFSHAVRAAVNSSYGKWYRELFAKSATGGSPPSTWSRAVGNEVSTVLSAGVREPIQQICQAHGLDGADLSITIELPQSFFNAAVSDLNKYLEAIRRREEANEDLARAAELTRSMNMNNSLTGRQPGRADQMALLIGMAQLARAGWTSARAWKLRRDAEKSDHSAPLAASSDVLEATIDAVRTQVSALVGDLERLLRVD